MGFAGNASSHNGSRKKPGSSPSCLPLHFLPVGCCCNSVVIFMKLKATWNINPKLAVMKLDSPIRSEIFFPRYFAVGFFLFLVFYRSSFFQLTFVILCPCESWSSSLKEYVLIRGDKQNVWTLWEQIILWLWSLSPKVQVNSTWVSYKCLQHFDE